MAIKKVTTADSIAQIQEHIAHDELRLNRIEGKIDKLADTLISLARAEEKLTNLEADRVTIVDRLNKHSDRIDTVEDQVIKNEGVLAVIGKVFWICLTALAGAAAVQYLM